MAQIGALFAIGYSRAQGKPPAARFRILAGVPTPLGAGLPVRMAGAGLRARPC